MSLSDSFVNSDNNLQMSLQVFPSGKTRFDEVDVSTIGYILSKQVFKPTKIFGPYYFLGEVYSAAPGEFENSTTSVLL